MTTQFTMRCKAFSCEEIRNNKILVDTTDGEVRVWDSVAGFYTICHALSERDKKRAMQFAGSHRQHKGGENV